MTMSLRFVCASLLALASPALGAEWTASFPPEALATYLDGAQRTLVVAAAGDPVAEVRGAASALEDGLRRSGKARLVMGDASVGSLLADDDASVVRKCKALPVELVAVTRVFSGGQGAPPSAVVTLYDKAGNVLMALTTTRGTPLQPRQGSGASVAIHAPEASSPAAPEPAAADPQRAKYDERSLWAEANSAVMVEGTSHTFSALAYQGKGMRPLVGADFYRVVGREDLASEYSGKVALKVGAGVVGTAGAVVGLGMMLFGGISQCVKYDGSPSGTCLQRTGGELFWPGMGLSTLGLAAILFGTASQAQPVTAAEVRRMVEEYNQKLKRELGLVFAPLPGGAAVAMGGTF